MKKQIFRLFAIGVITMAMLSSCKKDTSQEDIILNQQKINVAVRIVDASNNENPLDSAVVEILNGAVLVQGTTDASGLAYFSGVTISDNTPVTVTKTGYASVISEIYLLTDDYRQGQVSQKIALYPTDGDNMVTISGNLTIETDVTNREREAVPVGTMVRASNQSMSTTVAFIGLTDTAGYYSIKVPVDFRGGDYIYLRYPEIYTNQTVAIENEKDYSIEVKERLTQFVLGTSAKSSAIPGLPSAYAAIDAPAASTVGQGFSLSSVVVPTSLTSNSDALLISGGSGYPDANDTLIYLTPGVNGDTAQIEVDIVNGSIVRFNNFVNNGALYTEAPSFSAPVAGGVEAVIDIQFGCQYRIFIENNGSDYIAFPRVSYTYQYYDNTTLVDYSDGFSLSNYTDLAGGKIVNDNFSNVDTIVSWSGCASKPVFTVVNPSTEQMYISFNSGDIDANGKIIDYIYEEGGYGYNSATPPAINIMTVAGYGSGAEFKATLETNGELDEVRIVNQGTGYVKNVNDFRDDGTTGNSYENPSYSTNSYDNLRYIYNVTPGSSYERSAHYGTGTPKDDF